MRNIPIILHIIGAASASSEVKAISAIMRSKRLQGSCLALVDWNVESL
jgi:hypothetical protein